MRAVIFKPIVITVSLATASAQASCLVEHETVIRGRFVRCERAQFYWDASGADRVIQKSLDQWLSETDPQFREELRIVCASKTFCPALGSRALTSSQWC